MSKKNSDTAIIIPVYNEGAVIGEVLGVVLAKFKYVVCVNDGSADDSASEIEQTGALLVNHPFNMGQGAALQTGIEFAARLPVDYFVTFDSDGQHRIEDATSMLKELKLGKQDIILGSRFLGGTIGMKKTKKVLLKAAIKFSNLTTGLKLTDTHNGLRAFNRHVAETINITMPDMTHASEILDTIKKQQYRYKEVPVVIKYTEYSRSKGQGLVNAINIGFDMLLRKVVG
jgi:glycosyltransferase involved in cell wall biosynthesis